MYLPALGVCWIVLCICKHWVYVGLYYVSASSGCMLDCIMYLRAVGVCWIVLHICKQWVHAGLYYVSVSSGCMLDCTTYLQAVGVCWIVLCICEQWVYVGLYYISASSGCMLDCKNTGPLSRKWLFKIMFNPLVPFFCHHYNLHILIRFLRSRSSSIISVYLSQLCSKLFFLDHICLSFLVLFNPVLPQ